MAAEKNTITEENLIEEILIEEVPVEESGIRNITDTRKFMEDIQRYFKRSAASGETPTDFSSEASMSQIDKIKPYKIIIKTLESFFPEVFDCFDEKWTIEDFFEDLENNEFKLSGLRDCSGLFLNDLCEKVAGQLKAKGVPDEYYKDKTKLKKRLMGKTFANEDPSQVEKLFLEVYAPGLGFSSEQINSFLRRVFKRADLYLYVYQEFILYIVSKSIEIHIEGMAESGNSDLPGNRSSEQFWQEIIEQNRRPMHKSLSAYKVYTELIAYYEKLKADITENPERWEEYPIEEFSGEDLMNAVDSTLKGICKSSENALFEGEVCNEDTIHPMLQQLLIRFAKSVPDKAKTVDTFCKMMNHVLCLYSQEARDYKESKPKLTKEERERMDGIGTIQILYSSEEAVELEEGMEFYLKSDIKGIKDKVPFLLVNRKILPPASEGTASLKVECMDTKKIVPKLYAWKEARDYGKAKFTLSYSSNSEIVLKKGTLIQCRRKDGQEPWMDFGINEDMILSASKNGEKEIPIFCKKVKQKKYDDLPNGEIELIPKGSKWITDCDVILEVRNDTPFIYQKRVDTDDDKKKKKQESTITVNVQSCEEYDVSDSPENTPGYVKKSVRNDSDNDNKYKGQQWDTKIKGIHRSDKQNRLKITVKKDITFDEQEIRAGGKARAKGILSIKCTPGTSIPKGTVFSRYDPVRNAKFNYETTEYAAAVIGGNFFEYLYQGWTLDDVFGDISRELFGEWFASTEIDYNNNITKIGSTLPMYKDYVQLKNHFMTLVFLSFVAEKVPVGKKTSEERKELRSEFKKKVKEVLTSVTSPLPEFYEGNKYEWLLMYLVGRENPIEDFRCLWAIEKERQREILDEKKRTSAKNKAASK